eukprot:116619-Rhodomonas_salina.1
MSIGESRQQGPRNGRQESGALLPQLACTTAVASQRLNLNRTRPPPHASFFQQPTENLLGTDCSHSVQWCNGSEL